MLTLLCTTNGLQRWYHVVCHLLSWASGRGATKSPAHVLNTGISQSCQRALRDAKLLPNQQSKIVGLVQTRQEKKLGVPESFGLK